MSITLTTSATILTIYHGAPGINGVAVLTTTGSGAATLVGSALNIPTPTPANIGAVPTSRTVNGHALSSDVTVTKSDVSLGNADNTSDVNKPVSTAQASADSAVASGAASDATTKANAAQAAAIAASAQRASNLSDLASASTARTNLGLGTLATQSGTFSGTSSGTNTGDQDLNGLVPKTTTVNGHALSGNVTVTTTDLNLNSVTNDVQTKAAVVPNTAPSSGQILVGNGAAYAPVTLSGPVSVTSAGVTAVSTLNQNTSGTAANLSGTPALPNGTSATTQSTGDNSTKLATTAYADTKLAAYPTLSSFTTALAEAGAVARGLTLISAVTGATSTSLISKTNHHRAVGDKVQFASLTGGSGLSINTNYFVIADGLTADVFKVSATVGGSAIAFSTDITAGSAVFYSRRVNVIQIGDSTGADIFENGPFNIAHAAYGFGGLQNVLSNYGGGNLTLTNVSYNSTRVNSMLGQYSMDTSGATVEVFPDEYYFPQVPNPGFSGHVFPPQNLTGFRVVWIKGSGSFKIQHSAYNYYGDSLWATPTWVDDVTVDTSTGSAPIQSTETTLPSGLYRCRILQTAGTPLLSYWGFLGASGFNRGGPYGAGGDYLSNFLLTPAANWAAQLAISNPDLITLQFKNNGSDTLAAWTTQLATLVGYINTYAPKASVCLVGNYNSLSDDSYSGPNMTMPQQRVLLQSVAATNGWAYIDASQVLGATYAIAAANGVMNDTVHSNDAGKAALTGYFSQLAKMFTAGDCLPPYQPRVTGVTPGVYTGNGLSITVDPAGKITAASTPAQTQNYYSKTVALDISAIGGSSQTLTFSASDDGAVYLVTTGTKILNFQYSTTQRDGFNVTLIKIDTGSGYIAQSYQTPYVGTCGQKGDGVRVMQASSSSFVETFSAAWAAGGSGAAAGSGAGRFMQGSGAPPSGAAVTGTLYADYSNHVVYVCTGGGTSPTWNRLATTFTATATLDFPSTAAAAQSDLTITVTGAAVGDSVSIGLPSAPAAGIVWNGFVSATNTVTIRATNITGSAVDPASATYRATIVR